MKSAALPLALLLACSSNSFPGSDDPSNDGDENGEEVVEDFAPGCPSVREELRAEMPTIFLVVDRSASMNDPFGDRSRWDAVYTTLMDSSSGLVRRLEDQVSFGLALYSGEDNDGTPTCPIVDQFAPSISNYAALEYELGRRDPIEDTPTGESLDLIVASFSSMTTLGPKAIVVATDGEPDSCADPDPDGQPEAKRLAVEAAARAYAEGIPTYLISVGADVSEDHLQKMANAGVGLPEEGPERAPFYKGLDANSLGDAFSTIVNGVRGCSFELDGPVTDPSSGTVTLDGIPLTLGADWEVTGTSTLDLVGEACDTLLAGGDHEVEAVFECGGGPIVE